MKMMLPEPAAEAPQASTGTKLSGLQKAAIVLIALGPAESGKILKRIPEEDADTLAKAVARCENASAADIQQALEEFDQYATSHRLMMKGGVDYAQKLLLEAYGPEMAGRLIERLTRSLKNDSTTFEKFRKVDPQQLAKFIQDEHPQTIALILSNLDSSQAATMISSLPAETRTDVAMRMADLDQISPEIVRNIASVIDQKLQNLGEMSREAIGGVRAVANMFNRLDPNTCSQLLDGVEAENAPLFEHIRRFMFVFRDLENLDTASIRTLISKVERNTLLTALKGANESLRQKVFQTQSQRGAEMMSEDLESLGPVKLRDVDAAQQSIIAAARELEKEGAISLGNSASEQYVY
ncbi:MAG: flagellar motor switch protein FliG [Acidobacteriaceae bacterium]|nr:flagellar motor switch protein FliG [Acidobacteriaceae bacterium]